jgi:hypothetical protein
MNDGDNETPGIDLLRKPVEEAVKIATKGAVDGVGAFLSRICLPAAEEFGLLCRDCEFRAIVNTDSGGS